MIKVSIIIDCDACRCLFRLSHFASEDITAWRVHGGALLSLAEDDGWVQTSDGNYHYCPGCLEEDQDLYFH
jgi:hypothetical protein